MRQCACVALNTESILAYLTYESMRRQYGRVVTREDGVAWARCPHCSGTGVDPRP
jgi:hypothetical protein